MRKILRRRNARLFAQRREPTPLAPHHIAQQRSSEAKMAAFDCLPREIRVVLAGLSQEPVDCQPILDFYYRLRQRGLPIPVIAQALADELSQAEHSAISAVSERYRARFGIDLPHVAAGASVLRPALTR